MAKAKATPKKTARNSGPAQGAKARTAKPATKRAARPAPRTPAGATSPSASRLIDAKIRDLGDWRGALLGRLRAVIRTADPHIVEEVKWRGVPVWSRDGIICTGETYKSVVKLTFARGAALPDPARLFNASLEGNTRRAIDVPEGATVDAAALTALVRAAVALNTSKARR